MTPMPAPHRRRRATRPVIRPLALSVLAALGAMGGAAELRAQAADAPATGVAPVTPVTATTAATAAVSTVVITATRTEARAFDVPASIDRIDRDVLREGRAQVNISEALGGVPGLLARDRQNYAQDVQISVRGFGARASFGIRGVRLYVDGIPATLPDGQGQITHVDLGSAERIEVLRGPFSALYGNSSGGVLQVFTEPGSAPTSLNFGVVAGSDGLRRESLKLGGAWDGLDLVASASRFRTDGYREHSATERRLGNLRLGWRPAEDTRVTLVANTVDLPLAQDPLGLTRAQWQANPRGVDASALAFDTRKTMRQTQAGVVVEQRVNAAHALRLMVYAGERSTEQFQAIPAAPQANALHPGGVIQLDRRYQGLDARWTHNGTLADGALTVVAGVAVDRLQEDRRGRQNFIGPLLGVEGALRRDERNEVDNVDPYLQASWAFAPRWTLHAGVRRSDVRFDSQDRYVAGINPDDSGSARYDAWLPVLALGFAASPALNLYATAGRGFETPTLNELSYRPNGATGLNFDLKPARSDSVEAGAKWKPAEAALLTAALFETRTDDEIVTLASLGGRTTFRNAGSTRRRGAELGWTQRWAGDWSAQAALTALQADVQTGPSAGRRLPGVARSAAQVSVGYAPATGLRMGAEARVLGRVMVNDANTDAAAGHAVLAAHAGYAWRAAGWTLTGFVRGDNLADRRYAGSVIVNEANFRFFEPAPGRTWTAGLAGTVEF